jgi:rhamnose transport system permease protein
LIWLSPSERSPSIAASPRFLLKERGVSDFSDWYQAIGFGTVGSTPIPWSVVIFLLFFSGFAVYLHRTRYGRVLYAIGNNRQAARFSGVNVGRVLIGVFVTSRVMCSVAAIVLTAYLASARSDTAIGLELPVITAVVVGGVNIFGGSGTLGGVLIALMVLAFVQNSLGLAGVTSEEQQIVTGAVLILTLWRRHKAAAHMARTCTVSGARGNPCVTVGNLLATSRGRAV